jgi:cell division protein FtsI (penicillin-binding protein 3)
MNEVGRFRIAGLAAFFLLLQVIVLGRAAQLTLVDGEPLRVLAGRQHEHEVALQPQRGAIADRNGKRLALSVQAASIYLRPKEFVATKESIAQLTQILGVERKAVEKATQSTKPFVWIKRRAAQREWNAIEKLALPGVGTELASRRVYPQGDMAAQLLGISNIDGHGVEGLELKFNGVLQGEAGVVVEERDAHGRPMFSANMRRPVPRQGGRVELTIDSALQHVAETELARTLDEFHAAGGLILALEPHTGEVLAMAQAPRLNPNAPDISRLDAWRNKAITDCFEPGSTMKPFVVATALEQGDIRPTDRFFCENGSYAVGGRTVRDHDPYGWLTIPEIIQHSSNICTAKIGERLGRDRLGKALRAFGFGGQTHVDLPGEVPGIFPDPGKWGRIHVVTNSFGQGSTVTAMQLARAYGALANGGRLMRPYVVRRVVGDDGTVLVDNRPQIEGNPISPKTAKIITGMMELVVEAGTATKAKIPGVLVAGKTGTAQKVDPNTRRYSATDRISSFVGFAPADDPRIVVAVVIDRPRTARYGGIVAAPAFKRFTEYALETMGIAVAPQPPSEKDSGRAKRPAAKVPPRPLAPVEALQVAMQQSYAGGVPNLLGRGMRDAMVLLDERGFHPQVEGWGVVIAQDPLPGTDVPMGSAVRVRFDSTVQ